MEEATGGKTREAKFPTLSGTNRENPPHPTTAPWTLGGVKKTSYIDSERGGISATISNLARTKKGDLLTRGKGRSRLGH